MSLISKNWWKEAKLRWNNKTHDFFKRMKLFIIVLVAMGPVGEAAILKLESEGVPVPNIFSYICVGLTLYGVGMATTAKLTTQDERLSEVSRKAPEEE